MTMRPGCIWLFLIMTLYLQLAGGPAQAQCPDASMSGVWKNSEAQLHHLIRLEIKNHCDIRRPFDSNPEIQSIWKIRAWSRCSPGDCGWGNEIATLDGEGRLEAVFRTFSARRTIRATLEGNKLRIHYLVDYFTDQRTDLAGEAIFSRSK